ncbi:16872_t:CDS:1, partial [Gigaspora margarita]
LKPSLFISFNPYWCFNPSFGVSIPRLWFQFLTWGCLGFQSLMITTAQI